MFLMQIPLFYSSHFTYRAIIKFTQGLKDFYRLVVPDLSRYWSHRLTQQSTSRLRRYWPQDRTPSFIWHNTTVTTRFNHWNLVWTSIVAVSDRGLPRKNMRSSDESLQSQFYILFLTLPVAAFFIFARTPLVRLFSEAINSTGQQLCRLRLPYLTLLLAIQHTHSITLLPDVFTHFLTAKLLSTQAFFHCFKCSFEFNLHIRSTLSSLVTRFSVLYFNFCKRLDFAI